MIPPSSNTAPAAGHVCRHSPTPTLTLAHARPLGPPDLRRAPLGIALVAATLAYVGCSSDGDGTSSNRTDGGAVDSSVDGGATPPVVDASTSDSSAVGTTYTYSSQPSASGADATLALLNTQGAEGRAYIGPYLGGGLPTGGVELFVRPTPTVALTYVREAASRQTPEAFVAQLDAKGAQGFAFKGPLLLGVGTELVFVKNAARGVTYTYATEPSSDDEAATQITLTDRGSKGFVYLTDYITDNAQPSTRVRLFQKVVGSTTTYRYAFSAASNERPAAEAELGARGQTGGVWKGALAFGATSRFLFETASTTTAPLKYAIEDEPGGDTNAVLARLNARGAEGYYYLGPYVLGGKSTLVLMQGPPTALALTGTVLP